MTSSWASSSGKENRIFLGAILVAATAAKSDDGISEPWLDALLDPSKEAPVCGVGLAASSSPLTSSYGRRLRWILSRRLSRPTPSPLNWASAVERDLSLTVLAIVLPCVSHEACLLMDDNSRWMWRSYGSDFTLDEDEDRYEFSSALVISTLLITCVGLGGATIDALWYTSCISWLSNGLFIEFCSCLVENEEDSPIWVFSSWSSYSASKFSYFSSSMSPYWLFSSSQAGALICDSKSTKSFGGGLRGLGLSICLLIDTFTPLLLESRFKHCSVPMTKIPIQKKAANLILL